jgi:multidrug resistance efflux pump
MRGRPRGQLARTPRDLERARLALDREARLARGNTGRERQVKEARQRFDAETASTGSQSHVTREEAWQQHGSLIAALAAGRGVTELAQAQHEAHEARLQLRRVEARHPSPARPA